MDRRGNVESNVITGAERLNHNVVVAIDQAGDNAMVKQVNHEAARMWQLRWLSAAERSDALTVDQYPGSARLSAGHRCDLSIDQ
jgi:hypothetical protein